jgi:di/tricarboxylate transporter
MVSEAGQGEAQALDLDTFSLAKVTERTPSLGEKWMKYLGLPLALVMAVRFGRRAPTALPAFVVLQLLLAPLIHATAARSVMTLPIIMIIAAIYGSTVENPNRFGKSLSLLNRQGINIFSSGFLTGSTCNIIAAAFILDMASHRVYYSEWLAGALPVVIASMFLSWFLCYRFLFRLKSEEYSPTIEGGIGFWTVYTMVIAVSMFSHIFFASKTIRTLILIPFVIAVAQRLGFSPVALALDLRALLPRV